MKIQSFVYKFVSLYSLCTFFAFFSPLKAQESTNLQKADSLFERQMFTQAYQEYQQVLESGKASPAMLLRMAYIQESLGNVSSALYLLNLYYQQTTDREVLAKIEELAASKKLSGYEYSDIDYFRSVLQQNRGLLLMGLMLLTGVFFLLLVYHKFRLHHKPYWMGIIVVLLLTGIFYLVNTSLIPQRAIIMKEGAPLMSGPSAGSNLHQQLSKGHRLKVLGKEDVWYRVEWNEQVLYVKENAVIRV
jgi:hypothetical protein